jgi:transcriptional regulator GlxA family with amidase domain
MSNLEIKDIEWLNNLDTLIHKMMSNTDLSTQHLAQSLYMSRSQLYRKLLILRGVTPKAYIQEKRLKHARQLLEQREVQSVKAVAYAVGMRKVRYFSEQFKVRFGQLPSEFLN